MRFLTILLAYGLLFAGLMNLVSAIPAAGQVYTYDAPDGSLAFTDDPRRVPAASAASVREIPVPPRAKWTRVETARQPHRWSTSQPSFETFDAQARWGVASEQTRRDIEDAETWSILADEVGVGRRAAGANMRHQLDRAERLEDACRQSGCLPGYLRRP